MEGNLIYFLAFMGGVSLYLVIATAVGRAIYDRTSAFVEDGRIVFSVLGGALFPIIIPMLIVALWINAMINIPTSKKGETIIEEPTNRKKSTKKPKEENEEEYSESPFKVGDLVTGIKSNPEGYVILYPGCVCRVLEIDEDDEEIKVKLIDHIDKEAHIEDLGIIHNVPWKNFTLIKPKKVIRKVVTKKKK